MKYRRRASPLLTCLVLGSGPGALAAGCSDGPRVATDPPASPASLKASACEGPLSAFGAEPLVLFPPFSPCVHDYAMRCSPGTNTVTVSLTPSPGATALLKGPQALPRERSQLIGLVSVEEGQALVAEAEDAKGLTEYWVRCLPSDFPELQMTANPASGTPPPGYYLVGNEVAGLGPGYAMVLDARGVPVWYVRQASGAVVYDVDDVVDGAISFIPVGAGTEPIEIHKLAPFETSYLAPTDLSPHELRVLSNGHYLVLANVRKDGVDLTGLTATGPGNAGPQRLGKNMSIADQEIVEVDAAGNPLWTWVATEHVDPARETVGPLVDMNPDGSLLIDVFHANSLDVDPATGDLLLSMRNTDALFYVERSSGKVVWKLGGTAYSRDGATHVPVRAADAFHRQHDARLLPGWSTSCAGWQGQLSVFDDESMMATPARAVIYDVVIGDAASSARGCSASQKGPTGATLSWQYAGKAYSASTGSFRILPDGSRIIGWGNSDVPGLVFTEVDSQGNDLLDLRFAPGNSSYRAIKVPLSAFDLDVLRRTAGRRY